MGGFISDMEARNLLTTQMQYFTMNRFKSLIIWQVLLKKQNVYINIIVCLFVCLLFRKQITYNLEENLEKLFNRCSGSFMT